ncbi:hypothetical protein GLAREA_06803 [Glarea lozoyensis ATCC 20868]|uniref:Uncharacterized protein n=1 Tax=Glarea lozoyensis (strain ATCC 20868 / MF5171) TaxID=1116229 RepID=S3D7T3_GLAL2|nr:uncharacterized protein GLAREA_06803 [Glarea lozoyensis ATCC 20868]EPE33790.1 hypothetical protein GLAREA_06803 [Glarea lozoyensis ATCC 20868]
MSPRKSLHHGQVKGTALPSAYILAANTNSAQQRYTVPNSTSIVTELAANSYTTPTKPHYPINITTPNGSPSLSSPWIPVPCCENTPHGPGQAQSGGGEDHEHEHELTNRSPKGVAFMLNPFRLGSFPKDVRSSSGTLCGIGIYLCDVRSTWNMLERE